LRYVNLFHSQPDIASEEESREALKVAVSMREQGLQRLAVALDGSSLTLLTRLTLLTGDGFLGGLH
jgi:hypothetical protein